LNTSTLWGTKNQANLTKTKQTGPISALSKAEKGKIVIRSASPISAQLLLGAVKEKYTCNGNKNHK